MTAPANDNFADATPLVESGGTWSASGSFVGSTVEPTEFDVTAGGPSGGASVRAVYGHTVWHRWTVPAAPGVLGWSIRSPRSGTVIAFLWKSTTGGTADTLDNITLIGVVTAGGTSYAQVIADLTPGTVYFLQPVEFASDSSLSTYEVRVGPNEIPPPPVQYFPNLPSAINVTSTVRVLEGVGYGPDRLEACSTIKLGDGDALSLRNLPLVHNTDGSPAYSMERWLQLLFEPPFTRITNARFWCSDYAPADGWEVRWGLATEYSKPSRGESSIAYAPLPTSAPGGSLGEVLPVIAGGSSAVSAWLVLQARCTAPNAGAMQDPPPHLTFAWTEA